MARRRKGDAISGWLVLDKPRGMTSSQAVGAVKRLLNAAKIGHAGTLDPLATGVLPLALGEATKVVSYAMDGAKTYRFTVRWGEERDTDDLEGVVTATTAERPDRDAIVAALPQFTGAIMQRPPAYSAIKVAGERAYDLARAGELVDLPERQVEITRLALVAADIESAVFEADCGKGTYVRSLARDLARRLGTLGTIADLRRTRVGPFDEGDAFSLDKLEEIGDIPARQGLLLPIETPLDDIPVVAVMDSEADRLRNGQSVITPRQLSGEVLITASGQPVGLGIVENATLRPKRLFIL
ncbi:MAG: tRNA pseudouridine(55) synthase TruB [Alphaproteobacteria bacterium]